MTRRLFVAGPSAIRDQVRAVIDSCKAAGWEITYDWTRSESWDLPLCEGILYTEAHRNITGVKEADVVLWLCSDDDPSTGAGFEAGFARALGKPVVAVWEDYTDGTGAIHAHSATTQCFRLEDALAELDARFPLANKVSWKYSRGCVISGDSYWDTLEDAIEEELHDCDGESTLFACQGLYEPKHYEDGLFTEGREICLKGYPFEEHQGFDPAFLATITLEVEQR